MTVGMKNINYRRIKLNLEKKKILDNRGSQKVAKVTFEKGKGEYLGSSRVAEPSTWRERNQDFGARTLLAASRKQC